jgi:hypothetical protein
MAKLNGSPYMYSTCLSLDKVAGQLEMIYTAVDEKNVLSDPEGYRTHVIVCPLLLHYIHVHPPQTTGASQLGFWGEKVW